jgi:hypothetical protein
LDLIPQGALSVLCQGTSIAELLVIILGEGLWIITYILIIRKAFRDRTYGLPITAITLNFTWEILYALICRHSCWVVRLLRYSWVILDSVIVWQLFRFGRKEQSISDLYRYFYGGVLLTFIMAATGNWTFRGAFDDEDGVLAAYMINFIMSILFVSLFYSRKDGHGLSYGAAWTKMIGTGILALATTVGLIPLLSSSLAFFQFLSVGIFLFDVVYILLMHRLKKLASATAF